LPEIRAFADHFVMKIAAAGYIIGRVHEAKVSGAPVRFSSRAGA